LGGRFSEGDDYLWFYEFQLLVEVWPAGDDFVGGGVPVVWGAAFQDVADKDFVSGKAHGFDHFGKQLSGPSDEGQALAVLLCPRCFSDEYQSGSGVALTEDGVSSGFGEGAFLAYFYVLFIEVFEGLLPLGELVV
jgi:hypothetical protein